MAVINFVLFYLILTFARRLNELRNMLESTNDALKASNEELSAVREKLTKTESENKSYVLVFVCLIFDVNCRSICNQCCSICFVFTFARSLNELRNKLGSTNDALKASNEELSAVREKLTKTESENKSYVLVFVCLIFDVNCRSICNQCCSICFVFTFARSLNELRNKLGSTNDALKASNEELSAVREKLTKTESENKSYVLVFVCLIFDVNCRSICNQCCSICFVFTFARSLNELRNKLGWANDAFKAANAELKTARDELEAMREKLTKTESKNKSYELVISYLFCSMPIVAENSRSICY